MSETQLAEVALMVRDILGRKRLTTDHYDWAAHLIRTVEEHARPKAALQSPIEPVGWRGIESAPKGPDFEYAEGPEILVIGDGKCAVAFWSRVESDWITDYRGKGNFNFVHATHWMPLPLAPGSTKPGRRETLRECADMLRMLASRPAISDDTQPGTEPEGRSAPTRKAEGETE